MTLPGPSAWPVTDPLGQEVGDLLRERTNSTPDALAVVDVHRDKRWTYSDFDHRVSRRVERLEGRYDVPNGRAGLLLGTRVAFAELYFAVGRRAAAVVPLNLDLPQDRLRDQAERADLDCLVCGRETEELATTVAPPDVPVASVDEPERESVVSLVGEIDAATWPYETPLDADRVVMFTSGTTGQPKGVRLTTRNLVSSAVGSADRLGVEPGDRWLACLPMYHMGGLAPLLRSTLYGTTTVIQREFDPTATARVMAEYDVTGVSLVPTMLARLLDAGWDPGESLRFVLLGGAAAPSDLVERALDRGVPVYPTYGTTETASQVATATPGEAADDPETVGRPLSVSDVTIRSAVGDTVDVGEPGEVVVSGPTVTPGYLDEEQTTAAFDADGFHTGDVGHRDEEGRLWIVGRLDDRIVTGGENVDPGRVAGVLRHHDDVQAVAVVGLADAEWGERVAALVVPAEESITRDSLLAHARRELATFAMPKTVAFTDSLPRTASGTVDRAAVRDVLRETDE